MGFKITGKVAKPAPPKQDPYLAGIMAKKPPGKIMSKPQLKVVEAEPEEVLAPSVDTDLDNVETLEDLALYDRYGSLADACAAIEANPLYARFDQAKKELDKRIASLEPASAYELHGNQYVLEVGVATKKSPELKEGWPQKVIKMVGNKVFYDLIKINLTDLKAYLTPEQLAEVLTDEQGYINRRKITAKYIGEE